VPLAPHRRARRAAASARCDRPRRARNGARCRAFPPCPAGCRERRAPLRARAGKGGVFGGGPSGLLPWDLGSPNAIGGIDVRGGQILGRAKGVPTLSHSRERVPAKRAGEGGPTKARHRKHGEQLSCPTGVVWAPPLPAAAQPPSPSWGEGWARSPATSSRPC